MTDVTLYLLTGSGLFVLGLHGLLILQSLLRRIMAVNLMGSGVFLVMTALAARQPEPDPVLHALVVTGLVVSISATALALRLHGALQRHGEDTPK
ncbi:MAG: NADH-quinone oxidoreductase subunit K [Pseudomonadota bacterium]